MDKIKGMFIGHAHGQVSDKIEIDLILIRSIIKNKGKYIKNDVIKDYLILCNLENKDISILNFL